MTVRHWQTSLRHRAGAGTLDPHINSLSPPVASAAAPATTVTVTGTNFQAGATVEVNQVAVTTTFVSPTELSVTYDPTTVGTVTFTVRNPNEEESNNATFTVTP